MEERIVVFLCLKHVFWAQHNFGAAKNIWGGTDPELLPRGYELIMTR